MSLYHRIVFWVLAAPMRRIIRPYYRGIVMSLETQLAAVVATLRKATGEIVGKIAELQATIDAGCTVDPAVQAQLDELAALANGLDALVPDAEPAEPSGD